MQADLLVSQIFTGAGRDFGLACVDSRSGETSIVDLRGIRPRFPYFGMTGLARFGEGYVVGLQGYVLWKGGLAFLDRDLRLLDVVKLQRVRDIHSIVALDDSLYIVSTGTDEIVCYTPADGSERVVFAATTAGTDTVHMNGLCMHQGRLVASMFGPKRERVLRSGRVIDVGSGEVLLEGLRQPHSISSCGDYMLVLDSLTGQLVKFNAGKSIEDWVVSSGYARGLCWSDGRLIIGRSRRRQSVGGTRWSVSTTLSLLNAHGGEHAQGGLLIRDFGGENAGIRFPWGPCEIYDVLPLDHAPAFEPLPGPWVRAWGAFNRQDYAETERILSNVRSRDPLPLQLLADAKVFQGDYAGALETIASAPNAAKTDAFLLQGKAAAKAELGQPAEAVAAAEEAHALLPESEDISMLLARCYMGAERPADAVRMMERVVDGLVDHRHCKQLSILYARTGDNELALSFSERAIANGRDDARALLHHARLLRGRARTDEARAALQLALEVEPQNAECHVELANMLVAAGDLPGAVAAMERAFALRPENAQLKVRLDRLRRQSRLNRATA